MLLVQQIHMITGRAVNMDVLALICRQLLINGFKVIETLSIKFVTKYWAFIGINNNEVAI